MSGSHGDLFHEIGKLVLAAHAGQAIDLAAKSEELAERYGNLGMPADMIARAIARALSAISVSMAIVSDRHAAANGYRAAGPGGDGWPNGHEPPDVSGGSLHPDGAEVEGAMSATQPADVQAKAASALFPSGLRLAVLS